ncbi:response regulator transcription factor [Paenibacillus paridis]|uniref:response regulator transcription factor n=1 Tax=Paenibacillus paridis TaxID=2583376 RepID=UPI00111EBC29|nr:response regulator [Paenibacillus paridis]
MYKVMVVDDEPWGRKAISKMIGELPLDLEVIAEARHGEEALELIRMSKPHIVVTDMNMPVMNGKSFLAELHKEYSEIKTVVISGYSAFEYMKAALTYQACEYVLKPVSAAELRAALGKAIAASQSHLSLQQQKKHKEDMLSLKREVFLQHVVSGRINNQADLYAQATELGLGCASSRLRLAVLKLRQYRRIVDRKFHGNADLLMYSVENIVLEMLRGETTVAFKSDDRENIIILFPDSMDHAPCLHAFLDKFHEAMKHMYQADVIVGLSPADEPFEQLPAAYHAAQQALLANPFQGTGLDVCGARRLAAVPDQAILSSFEAQTLKQALVSGKSKDMQRIFNQFVHQILSAQGASIQSVQRELAGAVELLPIGDQHQLERSSFLEPKAILQVLEPAELHIWAAQVRAFAEQLATRHEKPDTDHTIREIVALLDQRYFEDLSLVDMATRYHIDPSYLSKLFKTVTGENFIEYVSRKRIEKACELLGGTDRKIIEISELIGYENQRYFSQVFRKVMGLTPSEYRESKAQERPVSIKI